MFILFIMFIKTLNTLKSMNIFIEKAKKCPKMLLWKKNNSLLEPSRKPSRG
jgi:hypothetical protein